MRRKHQDRREALQRPEPGQTSNAAESATRVRRQNGESRQKAWLLRNIPNSRNRDAEIRTQNRWILRVAANGSAAWRATGVIAAKGRGVQSVHAVRCRGHDGEQVIGIQLRVNHGRYVGRRKSCLGTRNITQLRMNRAGGLMFQCVNIASSFLAEPAAGVNLR